MQPLFLRSGDSVVQFNPDGTKHMIDEGDDVAIANLEAYGIRRFGRELSGPMFEDERQLLDHRNRLLFKALAMMHGERWSP